MEKFIISGGNKLTGTVRVSGAKNIALKALVAACLTDEKVTIHNIPHISDFFVMRDITHELGGKVTIQDHSAIVDASGIKNHTVSLDTAGNIRASSMFLSPLLSRFGKAHIPNPGGCRIGARPIDRVVLGLRKMGVSITYHSEDGYFYAKAKNGLRGCEYTFDKNTHTGTETLLLAAVRAKGKTVLRNAAQEPEIDELITLLRSMGAKIKRSTPRIIEIEGVKKLSGAEFTIGPDRNEIVTMAVAAIVTRGNVTVKQAQKESLEPFLTNLEQAGGGVAINKNGIRFYYKGRLRSVDIETAPTPHFMTDWQGPWAVLMTQAEGSSTIHETVYESRFGYVKELRKLGARIELFNPKVSDPKAVYNFNLKDDSPENKHAIRITGPTKLHNGVVNITDLRAGATLVLAALVAEGRSVVFGVEFLDRGYEDFEKRLTSLGATIKRVKA